MPLRLPMKLRKFIKDQVDTYNNGRRKQLEAQLPILNFYLRTSPDEYKEHTQKEIENTAAQLSKLMRVDETPVQQGYKEIILKPSTSRLRKEAKA
jgi:hypothetical protein